jgi:hypothetical protein
MFWAIVSTMYNGIRVPTRNLLNLFYVRLLLLLYPFAVNIFCKSIDIVTYKLITWQ